MYENKFCLFSCYFSFFFSSCTSQDKDDKPRIQSQRITNVPNKYQAFTDLVFFDNKFFLTFRESDKHVYGADGTIKLLNSTDGVNWKLIKEFSVAGVDLRDPKFAVNGDELMLYIHGLKIHEKTILAFNDYRFKYSNNWDSIEHVTLDNKQQTTSKSEGNEAWPWRITWFEGSAYSIGYNGVDLFGVYKSTDGLFFESEKNINDIADLPTEATIRANDKGAFYVLVRRNFGTALLGKYDDINRDMNLIGEIPFVNFRGPNFLFLNEKQIIFSGADGTIYLGVYDLETKRSKILLNFDADDCGYSGMVIKDNTLWMSYYSYDQNIHGASIYIAKIKLEGLSF